MRGPAGRPESPKTIPESASVAVSVVIPAFQAEQWVRTALESVAVQQLQPDRVVEVVVVDDGSTDETVAIAQRTLDEFGLIGTVIRQSHGGVSAARNAGWRAARGDWIQFLDADDRLAETKLATQLGLALAVDGNCAVVYSAWQRLLPDHDSWVPLGPIEDPVLDEPVRSIIEDQWFGYVGPCLIRRDALVTLGGFDETKSLGEDLDLMLRLAIAGRDLRRAPSATPLYFYRQLPGSLWQRARKDPAALRGLNATETNAELHIRRIQENILSTRTRLALAERYITIYQCSRGLDDTLTASLLDQIAALRLRRAPKNAPRSARALATIIGLDHAVRMHDLVRSYIPSRR
ncbi:MAG: glycosyltransferase family 2 protein [Microbacteriaceae bacterium]|nr:MAG: glycosyltransferase family 2 protein [Microbacteriaceae bacterium]